MRLVSEVCVFLWTGLQAAISNGSALVHNAHRRATLVRPAIENWWLSAFEPRPHFTGSNIAYGCLSDAISRCYDTLRFGGSPNGDHIRDGETCAPLPLASIAGAVAHLVGLVLSMGFPRQVPLIAAYRVTAGMGGFMLWRWRGAMSLAANITAYRQ